MSVVQTGVAFEPVGDMFNLYEYAASEVHPHSEARKVCPRNNTRSEVADAVRYSRPYLRNVGGQPRPYLRNVGGQVGSNTNDTSEPVGLQDWSYAYDNIGNRTGTTKANAAADCTANALNQYTERSVPDSSDIIRPYSVENVGGQVGSAETNVTVTVNTNAATRQDYWYYRLGVDNLSSHQHCTSNSLHEFSLRFRRYRRRRTRRT